MHRRLRSSPATETAPFGDIVCRATRRPSSRRDSPTTKGCILAIFRRTTLGVSRASRHLPTIHLTQREGDVPILHMPSKRAALRHATPVVVEAVIAPVVIFYVALVIAGLRGALVAALAWSTFAFLRRIAKRDRVSTLLILDLALLTIRTAIAFATQSALLYFLQPMAWEAFVSLVLVGSAIARRPFTQRFAHDFCPLDPDLLARPRVKQYFVRISLLWSLVLMTNAGLMCWLLLTSSVQAFVLERTGIAWTLTTGAIACSIVGFSLTMRRDGITVQWGDTIPNTRP